MNDDSLEMLFDLCSQNGISVWVDPDLVDGGEDDDDDNE